MDNPDKFIGKLFAYVANSKPRQSVTGLYMHLGQKHAGRRDSVEPSFFRGWGGAGRYPCGCNWMGANLALLHCF